MVSSILRVASTLLNTTRIIIILLGLILGLNLRLLLGVKLGSDLHGGTLVLLAQLVLQYVLDEVGFVNFGVAERVDMSIFRNL